MSHLNIDRLKASVPKDFVTDINDSLYKENLEKDKSTCELIATGEYSVPPCILNEYIGIRSIIIRNKDVIIDISGKINADKEDLGLININNIDQALHRIEDTGLIRFSSRYDLLSSQVLYTDITSDIEVENKKEAINAISYFAELSQKYNSKRYDNSGLIFPHKAKSRKDSLVIYDKYKELTLPRYKKYPAYLDKIGLETLEKVKNVLRIERHIGSFEDMRKALAMNKKEISLRDLLTNNCNPVASKFEEVVGINQLEVF